MRACALLLLAALTAGCGARSDLSSVAPVNDEDCGAPWLLFTLISSNPDGSASFHVYARRADGTGGHTLALPQPEAQYPSATPDGASLLYADGTLDHLYLDDLAAGTEQQLATTGTVGFGSLSPDGQTVVYGDGNDLLVVGVDGPPDDVLLVNADTTSTGAAGYPVFTGDPETVVFAAGGIVQSIQTDGSDRTTLLSDEAIETFPNPALSPDRQELAAVVSCDGVTYEVRVYPLASLPAPCDAGTVVTQVSGAPAYYDLAWGPTGLIAYSGGLDVFLVSASGGAPTNFTADLTGTMGMTASASEPTWLPGCARLP